MPVDRQLRASASGNTEILGFPSADTRSAACYTPLRTPLLQTGGYFAGGGSFVPAAGIETGGRKIKYGHPRSGVSYQFLSRGVRPRGKKSSGGHGHPRWQLFSGRARKIGRLPFGYREFLEKSSAGTPAACYTPLFKRGVILRTGGLLCPGRG